MTLAGVQGSGFGAPQSPSMFGGQSTSGPSFGAAPAFGAANVPFGSQAQQGAPAFNAFGAQPVGQPGAPGGAAGGFNMGASTAVVAERRKVKAKRTAGRR